MAKISSYLEPLPEERGRNDDAQAAYIARVGASTSIPPAVLLNWFQQHPGSADVWSFLDLQKTVWRQEVIRLRDLPGGEIMRGGPAHLTTVMQSMSWSQRWVLDNVKANGTWHSPPILLHTSGLEFLSTPPAAFDKPSYLADGNHRFAALHLIKDELDPDSEHVFWIGSARQGE